MIKNLLSKRPFLVIFDVTKRCNSKCNMCSIWKRPSKVSDELSLSQIKAVFTDLKSFGIKQVFLQGGEPLLRADIFEIIELLIGIGLKPTLITNGLLLDKQRILKLSRLKCNVSISLDTLKSGVYKLIRGVDAFSIVKKNILFASKVKNKLGNWFINSTISEVNHDELIDLYDFSTKLGFNFGVYPYNYSIGKASAADKNLIFRNKEKVINAFSKLLTAVKGKDVINELLIMEVINYLQSNDYSKPCDALKYSIMVDELGRVGPCIELSSEFDLKKQSISDVWSKFNKLRVSNCYLNTPCFYGCTRASGVLIRNWFNMLVFGFRNYSKIKKLVKSVF